MQEIGILHQKIPVPFTAEKLTAENEKLSAEDYSHRMLLTVTNYSDVIYISLPAGKRELAESIWDCMLREIQEVPGLPLHTRFEVPDSNETSVEEKNEAIVVN